MKTLVPTPEQIHLIVNKHMASIVQDLGGTGECQVLVAYIAPAMVNGEEKSICAMQADAHPQKAMELLGVLIQNAHRYMDKRN